MKRELKVILYCIKKLPCGVIDSFMVVVSKKEEGAAKARYKSMGYEVY